MGTSAHPRSTSLFVGGATSRPTFFTRAVSPKSLTRACNGEHEAQVASPKLHSHQPADKTSGQAKPNNSYVIPGQGGFCRWLTLRFVACITHGEKPDAANT